MTPRPGGALLALALALLACRGGPRPRPDVGLDAEAVRRATARCPAPLTDADLDDLATYDACPLPAEVAALVRNDYADDDVEPPDLAALRRFDGAVPRSAFEAQLARFVDPGGLLAGTIEIDAARGRLRPDPVLAPDVEVGFAPEPTAAPAPAGAREGRLVPPLHPEAPYRPARRAELLAAAASDRPLAGLRVVVDPGHAGGRFARFEAREVRARPAPGAPEILLREGDLALRTALELRARLAARGAEVVLTREAPGLVHPEPLHAFRPWAERLLRHLELDPGYARLARALAPAERLRLRSAAALFAVRKQSRFASLRARARLAAAARPDLVLSVHFNAAAEGGPRPPREVLAMIHGAPGPQRLYNPAHRARALARAFEVDDFGASAHLGALCVRAMSEELGLPAAGEPRYPDHVAIRDAAGRPLGVDAWDGALLRDLDAPAVLAEGLYADAPEELLPLQAALAAPPGTPGTRLDRYAAALARCVEAFTARWLAAGENPFGP